MPMVSPYMEVMMQINHNIRAMVTQHALFQNNNAMTKSLEKLSTGLRINRAQDDAAGLAMSEQMRTQIRALGKAKQNAQDGQAALQIAEGALAEITNMMQRQRELAIQSATGTLTSTERAYLNDEFQALTKEIDRISKNTDYNGKNVLMFDKDENKSFGATKLNPYNAEVSFMEAARVVYNTFGTNLTDGALKVLSDGNTIAGTTDAKITAVNAAIVSINAVISDLKSKTGIFNESNIVDTLKSIISITAVAGVAGQLGGDKIATNLVSYMTGTFDKVNQTAANMNAIKDLNTFVRDVADALSAYEAAKAGEVDAKAGALQAMADTFGITYGGGTVNNSDGSYTLTKGILASDLSSISGLANTGIGSLDRIISQLKALDPTNLDLTVLDDKNKFISGLAGIFGSNASEQMQKDLQAVMNIDTSKMAGNTDKQTKELVMTWQKAFGELQESYNVYAQADIAVGTAASEVLHVGPNYSTGLGGAAGNEIKVNYSAIDVKGLGLQAQSITDKAGADKAIDNIEENIKVISGNRAAIGTYINRLDYTINNIASMQYNIQDAEGRIRDTDFSKETTEFTRNQIMVQSATSMLAQANSLPQTVLGLIG
jgi:flagellin